MFPKHYSRMMTLLLLTLFLPNPAAIAQSVMRTWELPFTGTASGGELILMRTFNRSVQYVSVLTSPGESAESVASRLADTINRYVMDRVNEGPGSNNKHLLWGGDGTVQASKGILTLPNHFSGYALAGTESGLGIPQPPTSLSCSVEGATAVARWINPPVPYDRIAVQVACYSGLKGHLSPHLLPGSAEEFRFELAKVGIGSGDLDFRVMGYRNKVPSSAAAIHVSGHSQDEVYGVPFANNVAPNWKAWTAVNKEDKSLRACTERYPYAKDNPQGETLASIPFYQTLKAAPGGAPHGIYRKFLGLTPGHTYRIAACVNTLRMDAVTSPWTFSLCAAPDPPAPAPDGAPGSETKAAVRHLTREQMAGMAVLPDGSQGPRAGALFSYAPGRTTKDRFRLAFTGEKGDQEGAVSHITLPAGVTSITVWLRFASEDPKGEVAFSGVMLEDVAGYPGPEPPDVLRNKAYKAEEQLMRGIAERMSRQKK